MKMLFVGSLNETLYSLSECLMQDFQVQICSENADNVKDMVRLFRPSIVVFFVYEISEEVQNIFSIMTIKYSTLPFLVIGSADIQKEIEENIAGMTNKKIMSRPVFGSNVRKECFKLLHLEGEEIENKENVEVVPAKEKRQILVVDDNALVLRNIKKLLEEYNYKVVLANSGEKALEAVKKNKIDLILLDYEMPGMSGREVFENLLSNDDTMDIPVVFLTSVAEKDQIFAVLKNSPFGYILKPPVNEKILSVIRDAIG